MKDIELRDYFAVQILESLINKPRQENGVPILGNGQFYVTMSAEEAAAWAHAATPEGMAEEAYRLADAMLKVRKQCT